MENKIIINADDFGHNTSVNSAVVRSFQRFLVTSTSLMANMPGFEDAVRLVHLHSFFYGKVGLHLNLTEGYPLTAAIRGCKRFCNKTGRFIQRRKKSFFFLSAVEQRAVYEEMKAQMERVLQAGITPSHLDSHQHIHTEWPIAHLLSRLGREYGILKIRLTRNMGEHIGYPQLIYRRIFNSIYLKSLAGVRSTDYFGDSNDMRFFLSRRQPSGKSIEVMVQPRLDEWGELVDIDSRNLLQKLRPIIDHRHTISYAEL